MNYELNDKIVVIAGGTTGIGEAVAYAMAEQGAKVVVCGRNAETIEKMNRKISNLGHDITVVKADVSKISEIKKLAETAVNTYGTIDVWINNACAGGIGPFNKLSEETFDEVINANFKSYWYGTAIASDIMKSQGKKGIIINTASFNAHMPSGGKALYSATKAAILNMTKVFAVELAKFEIRVVSISPGYTITRITKDEAEKNYDRLSLAIPSKRFATVDDMSAAYLFLASDVSNYINGVDIRVDGGKFATQDPQWSWTYEGEL